MDLQPPSLTLSNPTPHRGQPVASSQFHAISHLDKLETRACYKQKPSPRLHTLRGETREFLALPIAVLITPGASEIAIPLPKLYRYHAPTCRVLQPCACQLTTIIYAILAPLLFMSIYACLAFSHRYQAPLVRVAYETLRPAICYHLLCICDILYLIISTATHHVHKNTINRGCWQGKDTKPTEYLGRAKLPQQSVMGSHSPRLRKWPHQCQCPLSPHIPKLIKQTMRYGNWVFKKRMQSIASNKKAHTGLHTGLLLSILPKIHFKIQPPPNHYTMSIEDSRHYPRELPSAPST